MNLLLPIGLGLGLGGVAAIALGKKREAMAFPTPQASDWQGWNWPVPIWNGRSPVISDGFKSEKTDDHRQHLGADVMFRKEAGDPGFPVSSEKHFTAQGTNTPVIAAGPGKIWDAGPGRALQISIDHGAVSRNTGGVVTWYQHLSSFSRKWKKGDLVKAGDILGTMGGDVPPHYELIHLHFEMWFPRKGVPSVKWKANPAPYMRFWRKVIIAPRVG